MTNFDLSTYIRWLKPGTNNVLAGGDDLQTVIEPQSISLPSPTDYSPREESKYSFFQCNPFTAEFLHSPQKQEDSFQSRMCGNSDKIGSNKSSSTPTALGLLLRSSIFRELVEKNSNVSEDETDGDEKKNQHDVGCEDDFGGIFYDGIGDIPFICSSNRQSIELQEREHFIL